MATISVNPGMTDSKMICAGEYIEMTSEYFRELAARQPACGGRAGGQRRGEGDL